MNRPSVQDVLTGTPYEGYLYSYPHKSAYRPLDPPVPLSAAWANESTDALFLYLHVPFCEMRCGFCNLFTTPRPRAEPVAAYLDALERQAHVVRAQLGDARFVRFAIGGGTPTFLQPQQLQRVFDLAERVMGVDLASVPISVETSPETGDEDRLAVLAERGVDRVSIGVQSFDDDEVRRIGRPQGAREVVETIERIHRAGLPRVNIDLMYGIPGQTASSFERSLAQAIDLGADEVYLYPLYVRPLTGLGPQAGRWDDMRLALYRQGRTHLLGAGYAQASMRMFRRSTDAPDVPRYRCQEDGMVGLGVGARSYTSGLHYSSDYAVGRGAVRAIIRSFCEASPDEHRLARYGVRLDQTEQRRRFVILSLLDADEGLDLSAYTDRFGTHAFDDVPELAALVEAGAAQSSAHHVRLTELGIERSDAIGPWLRSAAVDALMQEYALR